LAFSIFFTLYYSDKQDREPFAMVVTILALTLCLTTVALYPVDIFLVSNIMDPATGLRHEWATNEAIAEIQFSVKIIYYVAYGLIAGFCFFWVPLAYFYFEELADEEQTTFQRLWASFKYTIFFILVACILLLTGLLVKPHSHEGIDLDWLRKVLEEIDGTGAMAFVAGVLALAGMGILVFYTAPGLVLLPLHLLAGTKTMPEGSSETQAQLTANHERQNAILGRYQHRNFLGGRSLPSDRDRADLRRLEQEELILESRLKLMKGVTNSWFHRCSFIVRPLQILGGLLGVVLSALLVGSIAVTRQADTHGSLLTNGDICGALCGHIFFNKELPNPINLFLLKLSPYFPADYMLVVMITLYMFWATIKGIISIGIRLLCVNLYKFRQAATEPQGLLAATMLLMLSLAGLSYTLTMSVAPEYSMFGSQKYCNYTMPVIGTRDCSKDLSFIIPCHVGAPSDLCVATVTSTTILKTILATPSFGIAFFYLQWLFLAVFAFALIFNVLLGLCRGFGVDPVDEDGDEDLEDGETRRLLS
ncbi:hypothetical protein EDD21DRAFT_281834, partial [Dissophora ornata]